MFDAAYFRERLPLGVRDQSQTERGHEPCVKVHLHGGPLRNPWAFLAVRCGLNTVELGVLTALRHEGLMRADLDEAGTVEHDDEVGHSHG